MSVVHTFRSICCIYHRNQVNGDKAGRGRSVAYLLGEVDDDLGETASKNAERGQDGTKHVDPHEADLSLRNELRRAQRVSLNPCWRKAER